MNSYRSRGVSRFIFLMLMWATPNFMLGVLITLVPHDFDGYHVGRYGGELKGIVNQIANSCDTNLIGIILFLSFGMYCILACNRKNDSVGVHSDSLLSLGKAVEFFQLCWNPFVF